MDSGIDPPSGPIKSIQAWQVLTSGVVLLLCAIIVMLFFSLTFDLGDDTMRFMLEQVRGTYYMRAFFLVGAAMALFLVLYLLDFSHWKGNCGTALRRLGSAAVLLLIAAGGMLSIDDFPILPLAIALLLLPFAALFLRTTLYRSNDSSDVSCVMGINFVTASLIVLIIWLCWLFGAWTTQNNHWFERRSHFLALAQCDDMEWSNSSRTQVESGEMVCLAAFLLWASPLMLFGICIFLGLFLILLSRTITNADASSTKYAVKFLAMIVGLTVFGMYSASSISGASLGLTYAAFAMYGVALVATVLISGATIGWSTLKTNLEANPYIKRAANLGSPMIDILHGLFVLVAPFYLVFMLLSFLNQLVRRAACSCGVCKPLTDEERTLRFTTIGTKLNAHLAGWQWTRALFWCQILCLCLWSYRYFTILVNILFNWLIVELGKFPWPITSLLFILIGLVMFLLPVVPGPVVYLTCGVLVVPTMEYQLGGRPVEPACPPLPGMGANATEALALVLLGGANATNLPTPFCDEATRDCPYGPRSEIPFWIGAAWANVISYSLKLVAHILQQKLIGETLGSRVGIRAMVSPNSRLMKAIRILLSQPGISMAKVSIMCGGPDWPTSVICGFLKLRLCNLLLGLTPMFLMTVPTTLTGAFLNPPLPAYKSIANFLFLIVLFVQLIFGVGMMHYVNRVLSRQPEDIAAIPDDLEVKALEENEKARNELKAKLTRFQDLPLAMKVLQLVATGILVVTFYLLAMMPSTLFQPFQLESCPRTLGDAPYDFIPSMSFEGFVALVGLLLAIVLMWAFSKWADAETKRQYQRGDRPDGVGNAVRSEKHYNADVVRDADEEKAGGASNSDPAFDRGEHGLLANADGRAARKAKGPRLPPDPVFTF